MSHLSGFIHKQGKFLLEHHWHAVVCVVAFALLPYTVWLSVAIIALVTLRKGERDGGVLLIAAMAAHLLLLSTTFPFAIAVMNSSLTFIPCYVAAYVLRLTASWRAVSGIFFLLLVLTMILIQKFAPDFITAHYLYIKEILNELQQENDLLEVLNDKIGLTPVMIANYLVGIQAVGIILSSILSLMLARSIQSQLYYPGGFRQEMLDFRGNKLTLLLLGVMLFAANINNLLAMNILPALLFYFMLAGLSLALNVLPTKKPLNSFLLLIIPLLLVPFVMLSVYVTFGALDSLFNFRLFLRNRADKRI